MVQISARMISPVRLGTIIGLYVRIHWMGVPARYTVRMSGQIPLTKFLGVRF